MRRYAAIDIGSNSVRMMAAEVSPDGALRTLATERQVIRLGQSVFRSGRIDRQAIEDAAATLRRMAQVYAKLDVLAVRAVATSAVRDAGNQREFLQRASEALGAPVEIVSGQEEARLIHLGVQRRWPHPDKRVLMVDVGGGSAEIMLGEGGTLAEAYSKPLGAVRLSEVFLKGDPPSALELRQMTEYIDEKLAAPLARIGRGRFDRFIATSATAAAIVCAVNRVSRANRDTADRLRASTAQIRRFSRDVSVKSLAARRKTLGIGPRRAEIIVAGTAVFLRVLERFEIPSLFYSAAGVRDGIVADLAARGVGSEFSRLDRDQRRTVEALARRYGVALPHARQVARLAHRLFEALQPLHKMQPQFGKLLEASAYLHDTGHYVSDTSHHKHSYYLIANSDLPGFTDAERQLVATLCRYHRKSMPALRHPSYESLDADTRRAVVLLTPLLRLADSLDRSHDRRVENIQVALKNGNVVVTLDPGVESDLEVWAAGRVAGCFREVYRVDLSLEKGKGGVSG